MNHRNYARCKACNKMMYPRWDAVHSCFEDLCKSCLGVARHAARTDEVLYKNSNDKWSQEDTQYVESFCEDMSDISDSMLSDDPYYEFGEDAFGDLNLFDKYE